MKPSIKLLLLASAVAFAGSASAAETTNGVAAATSDPASVNYNAEYEKCGMLPGSDQAACHDAVGMRSPVSNRPSASNAAIGSLQSADKCAQLNESDRRDCLLNDKAGD
jgi:hypothetical protein